MDDKKEYKTTLKALGAVTTFPTMLTKISDIALTSDDLTLKKHAASIHGSLRQLLGPAISPGNVKNSLLHLATLWEKSTQPKQLAVAQSTEATFLYCQSCIESSEPQWMILAREAGWTPPP